RAGFPRGGASTNSAGSTSARSGQPVSPASCEQAALSGPGARSLGLPFPSLDPGDSEMTTLTSLTGSSVARRSLAHEIDRLDAILTGLSDNLNEAVADAVKQAVGQELHQAVVIGIRKGNMIGARKGNSRRVGAEITSASSRPCPSWLSS